jgi:hypothetical protein
MVKKLIIGAQSPYFHDSKYLFTFDPSTVSNPVSRNESCDDRRISAFAQFLIPSLYLSLPGIEVISEAVRPQLKFVRSNQIHHLALNHSI